MRVDLICATCGDPVYPSFYGTQVDWDCDQGHRTPAALETTTPRSR